MRYLGAIALLLVLTATARAAEPSGEQAKAHVRKATAAYNLGKYTEAAKEYEAAYELTLDANMLFNVAQAHRLAGDREKAITAYRSFIRSAPKSEQRSLAETKLRELEQQRASLPGAAVAPVVAPAAGPTGNPTAAQTEPVRRLPDPSASDPTRDGVPTMDLGSASSPAAVPQSHFYERWPFWTAVGAVVVGGVVLGVALSSRSKDLSMPTTDFGTKGY